MSIKPPTTPNVALDNKHIFDETTRMTDRSGLAFVGAGVTVTDNVSQDRLTVTIPSAAASMGYLNIKDDFGAKGDGSTDDAAAFQAAFDYVAASLSATATGYTLLVPPGTYNIGTTVTSNNVGLYGMKVVGIGSLYSPTLRYTGAGSDAGLFKLKSVGVQFEQLHFTYNSSSFTGDLIKIWASASGDNTDCTFERCEWTDGPAGYTARSGLSLGNCITSTIDDCLFRHLQNGIVFDTQYVRGVHIRRCVFVNLVLRDIWLNAGEVAVVTIDGCTFEGKQASGGGIAAIDQTVFPGILASFTISNCDFVDDVSQQVPWLNNINANQGGLLLSGNSFYTNSSTATPQVKLGGNVVALISNYFECSISPRDNAFSPGMACVGNRFNLTTPFITNPASPAFGGCTVTSISDSYSSGGGNSFSSSVSVGATGGNLRAARLNGGITSNTYTPNTGAYNQGDLLVGVGDAKAHVCVTAGSQGTWDMVGREQQNSTLTYSASITPDCRLGYWQNITANNGTAFTINAPSNPPASTATAELTIEVKNSSGGALGVITWNGAFKFAGLVWANPANTQSRFARFEWNGANWLCTTIAAADY